MVDGSVGGGGGDGGGGGGKFRLEAHFVHGS